MEQVVDAEGQTWMLAEYVVRMWVPTDDPDVAQSALERRVVGAFPGVMENAPQPYVVAEPKP